MSDRARNTEKAPLADITFSRILGFSSVACVVTWLARFARTALPLLSQKANHQVRMTAFILAITVITCCKVTFIDLSAANVSEKKNSPQTQI